MSRKKADTQSAQNAKPSGCIEPAAKVALARAEGDLKPDLAYTNQQAVPGAKGWIESESTVLSKQKSKEEFPRG